MSKNKCTKASHRKDRSLAEVNTKRNKEMRLFRTAKAQPNNHVALEAFAQAIHPETINHWLERVKP